MIALIDEIYDQKRLLHNVLNFPQDSRMDLSKLICGGHSFGGLTAISVTSQDPRVRACVV